MVTAARFGSFQSGPHRQGHIRSRVTVRNRKYVESIHALLLGFQAFRPAPQHKQERSCIYRLHKHHPHEIYGLFVSLRGAAFLSVVPLDMQIPRVLE